MQKNQTRFYVKKLGFIELRTFFSQVWCFLQLNDVICHNVCEYWGMLGFIVNTCNIMYE